VHPILSVAGDILAHYLADLQDTAEAEPEWGQRSLAAVADLTDERLRAVHPGLSVGGFLPSLHLNLADDHRRLGDVELARTHLGDDARLAAVLPDDDYGRLLRAGVEHVSAAPDSGSSERLPTHP
jgi:hypothetical protein